MSVDKLLIDTLVTEHANLTAGALLVRNLAWTMEQKARVVPRSPRGCCTSSPTGCSGG